MTYLTSRGDGSVEVTDTEAILIEGDPVFEIFPVDLMGAYSGLAAGFALATLVALCSF